jgi:spore germination protein GerM
VGLGIRDLTMGRTTLKVVSSKMDKHEKTCSNSQHIHAFDTFGFLVPEVVNLLKIIQNVMHSNVVSPKFMNVVFQKLNFVVQKGLVSNLLSVYLFFMCNYYK